MRARKDAPARGVPTFYQTVGDMPVERAPLSMPASMPLLLERGFAGAVKGEPWRAIYVEAGSWFTGVGATWPEAVADCVDTYRRRAVLGEAPNLARRAR